MRGILELANQSLDRRFRERFKGSTLRLDEMIEGCGLEPLILNAVHFDGQEMKTQANR